MDTHENDTPELNAYWEGRAEQKKIDDARIAELEAIANALPELVGVVMEECGNPDCNDGIDRERIIECCKSITCTTCKGSGKVPVKCEMCERKAAHQLGGTGAICSNGHATYIKRAVPGMEVWNKELISDEIVSISIDGWISVGTFGGICHTGKAKDFFPDAESASLLKGKI